MRAVAPFRRSQVRPADAARGEVLAVVSHDAEKRVIGLDDPAVEVPDEDPDDIGVDQAPDLGFAFRQIAVETGVLQRDRRLGGEELQHRYPGRREDPRSQVVLEIQHAIKLALVDQWQAENGASLALTDVGILGKRGLGRGVVENDALSGAQHIVEHRLRQHGLGHGLVAQMHDHRVAGGRGFRLYPLLGPSRKNQQTSLGARLLDRGAHERVDQFFEDDLARDGLRHLDHGREVELFDRRPDRACWVGRGLPLSEVWI